MAMRDGRILEIRLLCSSPTATADFYRRAFGCVEVACSPKGISLRIGDEALSLQQATTTDRTDFRGNETGFQHFALAVSDMRLALDRLSAVAGWTPISQAGPEILPPASGGVTAFKFRDPEGHPLEFLQVQPGAMRQHWQGMLRGAPFLGIDHSAISVMDTALSAVFYGGFGFTMGRTQRNRGIEQARLDGLAGADVDVTPLTGSGPPHLELLRYRHPAACPRPAIDGSTGATGLVLAMPGHGRSSPVADPDGHRLCLTAASSAV
jgi:catechol 2,3-dioxygenase-like lactoylglutathione lyase family enzyme